MLMKQQIKVAVTMIAAMITKNIKHTGIIIFISLLLTTIMIGIMILLMLLFASPLRLSAIHLHC